MTGRIKAKGRMDASSCWWISELLAVDRQKNVAPPRMEEHNWLHEKKKMMCVNPWHTGCQVELKPRVFETRVSCSGVRPSTFDLDALGGAQCGEQRRPDWKHIKTKAEGGRTPTVGQPYDCKCRRRSRLISHNHESRSLEEEACAFWRRKKEMSDLWPDARRRGESGPNTGSATRRCKL